jgi:hypothetical protein
MKRLKTIVICLLLVLVPCFSSTAATGGNLSVLQENEKFSAALESQISCKDTLDPAKAIGALQRAGMIEGRSYLNYDSLNYFKAKKRLTVWGFNVVSIFGFSQNPRIFERGPGTAPPITLGVVVPYSEARIKLKLSSLGLQNIKVQRAAELDIPGRRNRSRMLTEVFCEDGL